MRIQDGKLVLELKDCHECAHYHGIDKGYIREPVYVPCKGCNGTGRTKSDKNRCGYKDCYFGQYVTGYNVVVCPSCNGEYTLFEPEGYTDNMPVNLHHTLGYRVYRTNLRQTWNEAHIGMGCLYSVTDYGECHKMTDEDLVAKVSGRDERMQGCKIVRSRDDLTVCDHLGIVVNDMGYSVRAMFLD